MIQAVIFDMDGLMVTTEPLHYKAFATVLEDLGVKYTMEDNTKYLGMSDKDESIDMVQRYGLSIPVEELVKRKGEVYKGLLTQATPQPGLMELLEQLQANGYKKAIASSSSVEEIATIAKGLKVEPYFNGFFSAELVEHGKPAPDLFLLAAKEIGVSPSHCLVLEDAPKGIEAAHRAGMLSYAVPSHETKDMEFKHATRVMESLREVSKYLEQDRLREISPLPRN